jgi:formylglycine-generating enzyme required for sulfatase activity
LVNAGENRLQDEVRRHAPEPDDWWRQVLLLAGAHPQLSNGAAGRLVEMLMAKDDLAYLELAARFAQDMTDKLPGPQRKRLQDWLVAALRSADRPAKERTRAGSALALVGDPRRGVGLREDGLPDIVWCEVPAGPFLMGSTNKDEQAWDDEKPQHEQVISKPYAISRYPITNAQYTAFVQAGGYAEHCYWTEAGWAWCEREGLTGLEEYGMPFSLPNHPVVGVSWYEMVAFCRWLTDELKYKGELTGSQEIVLPTESQWEKAARGTDGRVYPWGDEADPNRANYADTGIGTTSAVGCFPGGVSPYGIEDLSGNVWERTRSHWKDYPYNPADGREDLEAGNEIPRVVRGGAFGNASRYVRCACRNNFYPTSRLGNDGFWVVVSRAQPPGATR